jgi:glucose-1-phosphate thymidylyltransferase
MNIIIPMAGMGKRMRPHTLIVPKPLLKIAGKNLVQRIVEELKESTGKKIDNIHYITRDFGKEVDRDLLKIASLIGAKGHIHCQNETLGTAHAIYCAENGLEGEVLIAFADTLFVGEFDIEEKDECIIWTMKVDNPEKYGVVVTDKDNQIMEFVEKPKNFISDKAIIGIYYFKNGEVLKNDIKKLIDKKIMKSGEYQLTDNLKNLLNKGLKFKCGEISEWLDCGNKDEFLNSSKRILELNKFSENNHDYIGNFIDKSVYIGENVEIINSKIGPFTSIEDNCKIIDSVIIETIISNDSIVKNSTIRKSMIGNNCSIKNCNGIVNIGDYSEYESI